MIELDKKCVFHIPKSKYADGKLLPVDENIIDGLVMILNENGFGSFYLTDVMSVYNLRVYDEVLVTLFTSFDRFPEEVFKEWFLKNNDDLKQAEFAYEIDNNLFIEKIDMD